MLIRTSDIVDKADEIVELCHSRNPDQIAEELGIEVLDRDFSKQLGAYMPVLGCPFIFLKADMEPEMRNIVLLHEIGHHVLHKSNSENAHFFPDYSLFGMNSRMEYEANVFAAQVSLPDDEFLDLIKMGYNVQQIAQSLSSNVNLVALKVDTLIQRGYDLRKQEYKNKFLSS